MLAAVAVALIVIVASSAVVAALVVCAPVRSPLGGAGSADGSWPRRRMIRLAEPKMYVGRGGGPVPLDEDDVIAFGRLLQATDDVLASLGRHGQLRARRRHTGPR